MEDKVQLLESALEREIRAREYLESVLEEKTRNLFLSNQYYSSMFNSMKNGVIVASLSGDVENVNNSMLSMLESNDAIAINSHINDFFRHPNFKGRSDVRIDEFQEDQDYELVLKNTQETPVNCTVSRIKNNQKKEEQLVFVVTDMSASKKAGKEKAALQEQLIKKAYTDGLAENAIGVLHNIGNVLTAIIGKVSHNECAESLQKLEVLLTKMSATDLSLEKAKKVIELSAKEMSSIKKNSSEVNGFILEKSNHIAEVIAAQQRYANLKSDIKSHLTIKAMIDDCLLLHEERMLKRSIKVKRNDQSDLKVFIEKNGLAQTISNLVVNAVESIDERVKKDPQFEVGLGEVSVEVSESEKYVHLKVHDNGMGISEENLKKLFDFGFSTKERDSGFGLHNCANFMKKQDGEIRLMSEGVFKGATCELVIPKSTGND